LIVITPYLFWIFRARAVKINRWSSYPSSIWLKSYLDPALGQVGFLDFLDRIKSNLQSISHDICNYFLPYTHDHSSYVLLLICGFILTGFISRWLKKQNRLMEFYVFCYILLLSIWPVCEPRKLMPIVPFLYIYLFVGIKRLAVLFLRRGGVISARRQNLWRIPVILIIGIFLIEGQIPSTWALVKFRSMPNYYPRPGSQEYDGLAIDWSHHFLSYSWVKRNNFQWNVLQRADYIFLSRLIGEITPPDTVVYARKPFVTALISGRHTNVYPYSRNFDKQSENIIRDQVDYILVDGFFPETFSYLIPYIEANPQNFQVVARKGRASLLKVQWID